MRTFKTIVLCVAVTGVLLALGLRPQRPLFASPSAITFTVNTTDDRLDDDTSDGVCHTSVNTCALRAAIMQANHLTGPGVTTIILPSGTYTLTRPAAGVDGEDNGDLNLTAPLSPNQTISLVGASAASTIIDANQIDRLFKISIGRTATIGGVTLRNGYADVAGGGLYNDGTLTVTNVMVSGNQAPVIGGGIYNGADGNLTVINSTINHNTTGGDGAGVANYLALTVINSTLSQNNADDDGGGFYNNGTANIYNTTIVFNGANADADANGLGGGVFNEAVDSLAMRNVLVAGNNVSNAPVEDDCTGAIGLYGVNLMGLTSEGTSGCTIGGSGYWTYLNSLAYLGDLQDNGGPTWTHALLPGSNAIDGDNLSSPMNCVNPNSSPLLTDQRGRSRAAGSSCDMGAFEYQLPLFLPLVIR